MAYTKTNWQDLPNTTTPINATNLNKMENGIELAVNGAIVDSDLTANNGYIRYENGFQIAWKSATVTAGGTAWSGTGLYYSDHAIGNWAVPFTNIIEATSNINSLTFWTTCANYGNTSTGTIRAFRPNSTTQSATVTIIGIGTWK